jgi:hypothetical protein
VLIAIIAIKVPIRFIDASENMATNYADERRLNVIRLTHQNWE